MSHFPSYSKDKKNIKVLLLEGIHPAAEAIFKKDGYHTIETMNQSLSPEALIHQLQDTHILGIRSRTQITDTLIQQSQKLLAVGCFCIGTNQIDLFSANKKGVPVFNAPFANTRSVAELVLAEMILLLRGIPAKNAAAHRGEWLKSAHQSFEARGKTLGIVGYGHIGTQIGILAESLGMKVQFYDIEKQLSLGNATSVDCYHQLLATSDIVTFHVPATKETEKMMDTTAFEHLKEHAIIINASRGSVIDIDALLDALKHKKILGAALDVFPEEPKSNQEPFISALRVFDNVILTPHIGGSTKEAQKNIAIEVSEKLIKYSNNGSTLTSVNFPEVGLPRLLKKHRICHIHHNEPGILARMNDVFFRTGANVSAQYLQTEKNIGYVVTDLDSDSSQKTFNELKTIEGTIKTRILY
jgi:D-3-phosphoglycerate dehydrogenase